MSPDPHPISAQDLVVAADCGQIYIYSSLAFNFDDDEDGDFEDYEEGYFDEGDASVFSAALRDAWDSDRFVGVQPGFIDLLTPGQWNSRTPLRLEIWSAEPADDRDDWDHEVDADFDIPGGEIIFEASGGGPSTSAEVPAGTYRVRVSGQGFTELGYAGADGDDSCRLRLWPRGQRAAPVLRKRWPGWGSPGTWPARPRRAGLGRLGGREAQREVAERPGMVVVVALDAMGRVLLIRDDSAGGTATGLPAGPVDQPDGDCLAAARELLDEAGLRAETWSTLLDLPALPGETNAPSRAYLARDLRPVPVAERVRPGGNAEHTSAQPGTTWVTLDQAVSDVFAKVIRNGATAAAVVAAAQARDTSWDGLRSATPGPG